MVHLKRPYLQEHLTSYLSSNSLVSLVFHFGAGEQGEFGTESGTELPLPFFSFLSLYIVKDKKEKNNIYLLYLCYRKY